MELGSENLILHFILLGGIKSVKLATIYIKVRAEGRRTTTGNLSRARSRSIHLKDPPPRLWLLHFSLFVGPLGSVPIYHPPASRGLPHGHETGYPRDRVPPG